MIIRVRGSFGFFVKLRSNLQRKRIMRIKFIKTRNSLASYRLPSSKLFWAYRVNLVPNRKYKVIFVLFSSTDTQLLASMILVGWISFHLDTRNEANYDWEGNKSTHAYTLHIFVHSHEFCFANKMENREFWLDKDRAIEEKSVNEIKPIELV